MIETNDSLYVHAALQTPEHFGDDFKEVINASFFSEGNTYFPKRVIVGHMPVTEYCHRIADFNPYYRWRQCRKRKDWATKCLNLSRQSCQYGLCFPLT